MNKKEYIILFILVIMFALGIYFYFDKNTVLSPTESICGVEPENCLNENSTTSVSTQESKTKTEDQYIYIKDWKVYQNKKYGFEFQYPEYWKASGKAIRDNFVSFIDELPSEENPDTVEFSVSVINDKKYASLESYLAEQDAARKTAWEGKPSVSVRSSEKIKINGLVAIRREVYYNAAGFPGIETFIFKDGAVYNLRIDLYIGEIVLGRARLYDKVIGTFRFNQ